MGSAFGLIVVEVGHFPKPLYFLGSPEHFAEEVGLQWPSFLQIATGWQQLLVQGCTRLVVHRQNIIVYKYT